jgi:hypothetical protein
MDIFNKKLSINKNLNSKEYIDKLHRLIGLIIEKIPSNNYIKSIKNKDLKKSIQNNKKKYTSKPNNILKNSLTYQTKKNVLNIEDNMNNNVNENITITNNNIYNYLCSI